MGSVRRQVSHKRSDDEEFKQLIKKQLRRMLRDPEHIKQMEDMNTVIQSDPEAYDLLLSYHQAGQAIYNYTHGRTLLMVSIEVPHGFGFNMGSTAVYYAPNEDSGGPEAREESMSGYVSEQLAPEQCQQLRARLAELRARAVGWGPIDPAVSKLRDDLAAKLGGGSDAEVRTRVSEWVAQPHVTAMIQGLVRELMAARTLDGMQATRAILDTFAQWKEANGDRATEIEHPSIEHWEREIELRKQRIAEWGLDVLSMTDERGDDRLDADHFRTRAQHPEQSIPGEAGVGVSSDDRVRASNFLLQGILARGPARSIGVDGPDELICRVMLKTVFHICDHGTDS